jgi:nitrate/TMAO reductase-like tetraheme cytochrome c subunit
MAATEDDRALPLTFMKKIADKLEARIEHVEEKLKGVTTTIR